MGQSSISLKGLTSITPRLGPMVGQDSVIGPKPSRTILQKWTGTNITNSTSTGRDSGGDKDKNVSADMICREEFHHHIFYTGTEVGTKY